MKKVLLSVLALAFAIISNAQITLTSADAPSIGDIFVTVNDTVSITTTTPGANGASVAWDFSSLQNNGLDTVEWIDPSSTPYAADFPTANIVQKFSAGYNYMNKTSSMLEAVGVTAYDTLRINFSDNLIYFQFPMTYGSSFNDFASFDKKIRYDTTITVSGFPVTIDSVRLKRDINYTKDALGWGSLITPTNSYSDVLKFNSHEIDVDSLWAHSSSFGWTLFQNSKDSTDTYEWFENGLGNALLTINSKHDTVTSINYYNTTITSINNNILSNNNNIYPNPASDKIFINSENKIVAISIFDITGKIIIEKNNIQENAIDVSNIKSGIYFCKIIDNKGKISTQKLIKK